MSNNKKLETKSAALMKATLFLIGAVIIYTLVFTNFEPIKSMLTSKTYVASLVSMSITLLVAYVYGTAVSKFLKHTLEKALESQVLREE